MTTVAFRGPGPYVDLLWGPGGARLASRVLQHRTDKSKEKINICPKVAHHRTRASFMELVHPIVLVNDPVAVEARPIGADGRQIRLPPQLRRLAGLQDGAHLERLGGDVSDVRGGRA